MGSNFSVGQRIADQLAIPSIEEIYNDGNDNLNKIMDGVGDTKNQSFDTLVFIAACVFIISGGAIILYGDIIFEAGIALAERIKEKGIKIGFEI